MASLCPNSTRHLIFNGQGPPWLALNGDHIYLFRSSKNQGVGLSSFRCLTSGLCIDGISDTVTHNVPYPKRSLIALAGHWCELSDIVKPSSALPAYMSVFTTIAQSSWWTWCWNNAFWASSEPETLLRLSYLWNPFTIQYSILRYLRLRIHHQYRSKSSPIRIQMQFQPLQLSFAVSESITQLLLSPYVTRGVVTSTAQPYCLLSLISIKHESG